MLSSATAGSGEGCNCNCSCNRKILNRGSSSSSRISSTSSSTPSSFFPSFLHDQTPRSTKAMEEVWKDINLTSLNDHSTSPMSTNSTFHGANFQDFLARPFSIDPPACMVSSASGSETASFYCPASLTPPPVTALSLSSRPGFHFDPLRSKDLQLVQPHHPASKVDPRSNPFESLACSSSLPSFGDKRLTESDSSSGDRRNKRMIKNRESAARSRARKQAYTNELQLKVNHLLEENARLRKQYQQLCETAASQQKKKKSNLYRTSTAPF